MRGCSRWRAPRKKGAATLLAVRYPGGYLFETLRGTLGTARSEAAFFTGHELNCIGGLSTCESAVMTT